MSPWNRLHASLGLSCPDWFGTFSSGSKADSVGRSETGVLDPDELGVSSAMKSARHYALIAVLGWNWMSKLASSTAHFDTRFERSALRKRELGEYDNRVTLKVRP